MFGTWQPTSRDSSLTDRSPPARRSTTQRRLASASARATAALRSRTDSLLRTASIAKILSLIAQVRKWLAEDRDTQGVAAADHDAGMNIQLTCPWCLDDVEFALDESEEELVCSACATRMTFAPDPVVTFGLLYEAAA